MCSEVFAESQTLTLQKSPVLVGVAANSHPEALVLTLVQEPEGKDFSSVSLFEQWAVVYGSSLCLVLLHQSSKHGPLVITLQGPLFCTSY